MRRRLFLSVVWCIFSIAVFAQKEEIVIDLDQIDNKIDRVEIQRYIGYEDLLYRYGTLPYDVSANTAGQGRYFDISYTIFALFPIVLLLLVYKNKKWFYGLLITLILYLFVCFTYSYINVDGVGKAEPLSQTWVAAQASQQKTIVQSLLVSIYNLGSAVSSPVRSALSYVTGEKDHVTYPILFLLLVLALYTLYRFVPMRRDYGLIGVILIVFLFLWTTLSGGIIWYGYVLIPILLAISIKYTFRKQQLFVFYSSIVGVVVWLIMGYGARISNIDPYASEAHKGKGLIDTKTTYYATGMQSIKDNKALLYNNIGDALEKINETDAPVYVVGTSMAFDIENSDKRIIGDNILSVFFAHKKSKAYRGLNIVDKMIRHSGFKYLVVDLYTPTLDQTPEKSLTKKFQLLLNDIYNSKHAKLLTTDRVLEVRQDNGEVYRTNAVFIKGLTKADQLTVIQHGSYAIFEL